MDREEDVLGWSVNPSRTPSNISPDDFRLKTLPNAILAVPESCLRPPLIGDCTLAATSCPRRRNHKHQIIHTLPERRLSVNRRDWSLNPSPNRHPTSPSGDSLLPPPLSYAVSPQLRL
ncbi:hypothetical protein NMY22_g19184 [Coprinellus aureogranulatus]|nr:hypothetical protein NMY22_g19184 [Coprinellus aureogranulatus]